MGPQPVRPRVHHPRHGVPPGLIRQTDTMTTTAAALSGITGKTIVLTGSLAPARFAESDAVFNVGMAFGAVQTLPAGVYVVMNGQVFPADRVRKDRDQNAFVPV